MNEIGWVFKKRSKIEICYLTPHEVESHPLNLSAQENVSKRSSRRASISSNSNIKAKILEPVSFDPLGCAAIKLNDDIDVNYLDDSKFFEDPPKTKSENVLSAKSWESKCTDILSKYTTSERLQLTIGKRKQNFSTLPSMTKVQSRLEQLDELDDVIKHEHNLTQQEYTNRIEQLRNEMVSAWNKEDCVRALKIAIQCSKLLADTSVMTFYPSKFVLIVNIMDTFGKLVYDRLFVKSQVNEFGEKVHLPANFSPEMIPEATKETCRNWFYKISCIRELIPRLYIEMAILNCYKFLTASAFSDALMRLTRMIRGIGHPVVALYARCYLCHTGLSVSKPTTDQRYLLENFQEFFRCYEQVFSKSIYSELKRQNIKFETYVELYEPALDFILQRALASSPIDQKTFLVELLVRLKPITLNGLLLNAVICSFNANYISENVVEIVDLIDENCQQLRDDIAMYLLIRNLGVCLMQAPPTQVQQNMVFNKIWRLVTSFENPLEYLMCAEIWTDYIIVNFTLVEVNIFFGDILKHLSSKRNDRKCDFSIQLLLLLDNILEKYQDVESLLGMSNFLPLVDLFDSDGKRVEACRKIMNATKNVNKVSDALVVNAMMFLCKILHNSVNTLTVEDEKRQIAAIINSFIRIVDFQNQIEIQLNFYVEARASFINLEPVLIQLVQCVNRLSVTAHTIDNSAYYSPRKMGWFQRACAAYCFITIPSIESLFICLDLYLLSGRVALYNNCLGQAEGCLKSAISLILRLPDVIEYDRRKINSDKIVASYLKNFLSTLLILPDIPGEDILSFLKYFIQNLHQKVREQPTVGMFSTFVSILNLLAVAVREKYPYKADKVDSNDTLYGSDEAFIFEINGITDILITEILVFAKNLSDADRETQFLTLFELFNVIITRGDLTLAHLRKLAVKLFSLVLSNEKADFDLLKRTINYYKSITRKTDDKYLQEILAEIAALTQQGSKNNCYY